MPLAQSYDPGTFEARLYAEWEQSGVFQPQGDGPAYTILLPPPNVTGTLHMGHAFQHTLQDALIRYHRMLGHRTLWQMGTDHAGIATEMVVSRNLALEGTGETRDSLGRDGFIDKVWEWKAQSGGTIERQMRRLGTSGDWTRSVFTMDAMPSQAVIEAFVRLHEKGLIYRGKRLVNWDPVLKTAVSDLEVVSEEENGFLWSIRYPLADGVTYEHVEVDADGVETLRETRDYLVVATTRPETMLGDTAAMVHPEDPRYASLIGKHVELPLTGRRIPVIADDYVDRAFGTGVVKVTPAHDFNDYAVGQRHGLPTINLFTDVAALNDNAPERFRGLDRYAARKAVLAELEAAGLLVEEKPHRLQVPRGDRSGQVIEPYLTDQWFVAMDEMGRRGMELVESGAVKFVPPNWINTYRHWMENIQDWTISRQLWWGHRIPAWFDDAGNIYVGRDEAEARARGGIGSEVALRQDSDVLETWFSSALWPFSTLGWPDADAMRERGFDEFLPTSVLVTGFDIIFFWVARMAMMGLHFLGEVPFREVYITGLVRDAEGNKMSKSKGNVLDPLDLVDGISLEDLLRKRTTGLMQPQLAAKIEAATRRQFPNGIEPVGVDALRFTFLALASTGRDVRFDASRASGYRNFCNKIWNAANYVLMNTEGKDCGQDASLPVTLSAADRWIASKLQKLELEVAEHFKNYRFDLLAQALYQFIWNEYCDWYIELSKPALRSTDEAVLRGTRRTLVRVLETCLRLLHPLMPFVTEEIWQNVAPLAGVTGPTLMLQPYPVANPAKIDEAAEADIEWLKAFILGVRQIRGEMDIPPGKPLPLLLQNASAADQDRIARMRDAILFLARVEGPGFLAAGDTAPESATALLGQMTLLVPMAGLIDKEAELARLSKQIAKLESDMGKTEARVSNPNFGKAPEAVQQQGRELLAKQKQDFEALQAQLKKIQAL